MGGEGRAARGSNRRRRTRGGRCRVVRVVDALDRSLEDVTVRLCFSEDFFLRIVRIIVMAKGLGERATLCVREVSYLLVDIWYAHFRHIAHPQFI